MANAKKDKYDILADVVRALRDYNQEIKIETIGVRDLGNGVVWYENTPQMPTVHTKEQLPNGISLDRKHATSMKIGKNISIKLIRRKPTSVKTKNSEYLIDNGAYYQLRTPNGEAQFDLNDRDFGAVWGYALGRYDGNDFYSVLNRNLQNEKLREIAGGPSILKKDSDKYADAIKNLKALGVEPKKLAEYIKLKEGKEL